jgi:Ran-binding protein 1
MLEEFGAASKDEPRNGHAEEASMGASMDGKGAKEELKKELKAELKEELKGEIKEIVAEDQGAKTAEEPETETAGEPEAGRSPEEAKKKVSPFLTTAVPKKEEVPEEKETSMAEIAVRQEKYLEENQKDKVLLKTKCKLYYFSSKSNKLEERGEGTMLVAQSLEKEMVKITMVRDQVMRLGCNHYINPKFEAVPNKKIKNAWIWCSEEDTVEEDVFREKSQVFLAEFRSEEDSEKFKEVYDFGRAQNKRMLLSQKS